jgi:DnaJ-class molecular chaperone
VIVGLIFLTAVTLFVRHQYFTVMQQATSKSPRSIFPTQPHQDSRIKCVMCNGTGRSAGFGLASGYPGGKSQPQVCRSCHGTGWVDNPTYGR